MDHKETEKGRLEQTLFLIKPDGLHKSLTGNILTKVSETGMKIVGSKVLCVPRELAEEHYHKLKEAQGEKVFEEVLKYIQGEYHADRVIAFVFEGRDVIERIRKIAGATNPEKADPTTIRGMYGRIVTTYGKKLSKTELREEISHIENVVHTSESKKDAEREIKLWFKPHELTHTTYPTKEVTEQKTELDWEEK